MARVFGFGRLAGALGAASVMFSAAGQGVGPVMRYDGHKVVNVELRSVKELMTVLAVAPDHWSERFGVGPMTFRVSPEALEVIREAGIAHEVVIEDVQALVDAERARIEANRGARGVDWFAEYKTYVEISAYADNLVGISEGRATRQSIGNTEGGFDLYVVRVTNGDGEAKPAIFLNSLQHAREWITGMTNMYIMDRLVREYGVDAEITSLLDTFDFLLIPCVNADGYVYSWTNERLWRKTRRNNGDGTFGVDPNRNWSYEWGRNDGSSGNGNSETYRGPFAFSEACTALIRDYVSGLDGVVAHVDIHSYSQLVLSPWDWGAPLPVDNNLFTHLNQGISDAILAENGEYYTPQRGIELYAASGTAADWTFGVEDILAWTFEVRPDTAQEGGFILPPGQIVPTAEEVFAGISWLTAFLRDHALWFNPPTIPGFIPADTATEVSIDIHRARSRPAASSASLFYRIGSEGGFTESALAEQTYPAQLATLPATPCGETVYFYFQATAEDGTVVTYPAGGAADPLTTVSQELATPFADNFETNMGWGVSNSGGLTDGAWNRGVPVGGGNRGDPPTDYDGSGSCYLTDNVAGNSDVDGGTTTLTSPVMDATGGDAYVSYARWYSNTAGDSPAADIFEVEVSNNNGASWVDLETVGPSGPEVSGGWYYKTFRVADFVEPTDQFRIRFTAGDLGAGSVVEAGVDAVSLSVTSCPEEPCVQDWDGNGTVNPADVGAFLTAYFQDLSNGTLVTDIDGNGVVNPADVGSFLNLYFQPCGG